MLLINRQSRSSQNGLTALPFSALLLLWLSCFPLTAVAESCASVLLKTIATRWESLGNAYQTQICDRGCHPVIETWDDWTYSNAFLPLIDLMAKEMSLSDKFKSTFTRIGQDIAQATKKECAGILAPGQHLCNNARTPEGDKLAQWNRCFKKQVAKGSSKNAFTMLKLVSGEICKGSAYKYLGGDELWNQVLPEYMGKYADTCQAPSVQEEQLVVAEGAESAQNAAQNAENQEKEQKEVKDEL